MILTHPVRMRYVLITPNYKQLKMVIMEMTSFPFTCQRRQQVGGSRERPFMLDTIIVSVCLGDRSLIMGWGAKRWEGGKLYSFFFLFF